MGLLEHEEITKEAALEVIYSAAVETFEKMAEAVKCEYSREEAKEAITKQAGFYDLMGSGDTGKRGFWGTLFTGASKERSKGAKMPLIGMGGNVRGKAHSAMLDTEKLREVAKRMREGGPAADREDMLFRGPLKFLGPNIKSPFHSSKWRSDYLNQLESELAARGKE